MQRRLRENVEFLLVTQGWAQVRTGERRTVKAARTVLKDAAANVGVEVTTRSQDGFVLGEVKDAAPV